MVQNSIATPPDTEALIRDRSHHLWMEYGQPHGCDRLIWDYATSLVSSEDQIGKALSGLREKLATGHEQELLDRLSPSPYTNVADHKPATMSSRSGWSVGTLEEDASRATAAVPGHAWSFHTDFEDSPWWRVDLGSVFTIERVRIYNRVDWLEGNRRFDRFSIHTSDDEQQWKSVFEKEDDVPVGGILGHPFVWMPQAEVSARYVRLQTNGRTALALNRVEIFGF